MIIFSSISVWVGNECTHVVGENGNSCTSIHIWLPNSPQILKWLLSTLHICEDRWSDLDHILYIHLSGITSSTIHLEYDWLKQLSGLLKCLFTSCDGDLLLWSIQTLSLNIGVMGKISTINQSGYNVVFSDDATPNTELFNNLLESIMVSPACPFYWSAWTAIVWSSMVRHHLIGNWWKFSTLTFLVVFRGSPICCVRVLDYCDSVTLTDFWNTLRKKKMEYVP